MFNIPSFWSSSGSVKFGSGFNNSASCSDMEAAMFLTVLTRLFTSSLGAFEFPNAVIIKRQLCVLCKKKIFIKKFKNKDVCKC